MVIFSSKSQKGFLSPYPCPRPTPGTPSSASCLRWAGCSLTHSLCPPYGSTPVQLDRAPWSNLLPQLLHQCQGTEGVTHPRAQPGCWLQLQALMGNSTAWDLEALNTKMALTFPHQQGAKPVS